MNHVEWEERLGPLAFLIGEWEGENGVDVSPGKDGAIETKFREEVSFTAMGPVENAKQVLYGLRYRTTAWPLGSDEAFHEELGYWLWDAQAKQVMRCFMVPRGVNILAGGVIESNAKVFSMSAEIGSDTFGILSSPFLDKAFKTVRYDLHVCLHDDGFSYKEDTQLQLQGHEKLFHHTDCNDLVRKI